jgi:hypothetical protein
LPWGLFPGDDAGVIHGLVALGWFVTAPLAAIAFSLRAGEERLIVFPVLIWMAALAGRLMDSSS